MKEKKIASSHKKCCTHGSSQQPLQYTRVTYVDNPLPKRFHHVIGQRRCVHRIVLQKQRCRDDSHINYRHRLIANAALSTMLSVVVCANTVPSSLLYPPSLVSSLSPVLFLFSARQPMLQSLSCLPLSRSWLFLRPSLCLHAHVNGVPLALSPAPTL